MGNVVLRAEDRAQLRLHRGTGSVGDADDLLRNGDVVLEGQLGSVDHHGGKTGAQGFDDLLHALPVIQVQHHRGLHILGQRANCGGQALQLAVLDGCLTDCDDSGTVLLLHSLQNSLGDLHRVNIKGGNGDLLFLCIGEDLTHRNKRHISLHPFVAL